MKKANLDGKEHRLFKEWRQIPAAQLMFTWARVDGISGCRQVCVSSRNGSLEEYGHTITFPTVPHRYLNPRLPKARHLWSDFSNFHSNSICMSCRCPLDKGPQEHSCIWMRMRENTTRGNLGVSQQECRRGLIIGLAVGRVIRGGSEETGARSGLGAIWNQGQCCDWPSQRILPNGRAAESKL